MYFHGLIYNICILQKIHSMVHFRAYVTKCLPESNRYITTIFGFTKAIHNNHCSSSWDTIDILSYSLVNVLEGIESLPEHDSFPLYYIVIHLEIFIYLLAGCYCVNGSLKSLICIWSLQMKITIWRVYWKLFW